MSDATPVAVFKDWILDGILVRAASRQRDRICAQSFLSCQPDALLYLISLRNVLRRQRGCSERSTRPLWRSTIGCPA